MDLTSREPSWTTKTNEYSIFLCGFYLGGLDDSVVGLGAHGRGAQYDFGLRLCEQDDAPMCGLWADQAVVEVVDYIQARDVLAAQQGGRVTLFLAEDRGQSVSDPDFLLVARLDVEDGTLQHTL